MTEFCTQCGAARVAGNRFCAHCGKPFATAATPDPAAASPATPASPYVPPPIPFQAQPVHQPSPVNRNQLLIGGVALAALLVAGIAWWAFSDLQVNGIQPKAKAAADKGTVATAPVASAEAPYADDFLSPADEPMVTRGPVALLPLPGQSAGAPLRSMPENAALTGRWVRGTDGTSRWFRVNGGGYLPAAAVVAAPATAPVVRPFDMNAAFGAPLRSYFEVAEREHRRALEIAQKKGGDETAASGFATVPSRSLVGVTVTGVGAHWEASTVMFRENVGTVAAALRRAGWQVARDGTINVGPDVAESCSISSASQWPEFATYGATVLSCGV